MQTPSPSSYYGYYPPVNPCAYQHICPFVNATSIDTKLMKLLQNLQQEIKTLRENNDNDSDNRQRKQCILTHYCLPHSGDTHGQPLLTSGKVIPYKKLVKVTKVRLQCPTR